MHFSSDQLEQVCKLFLSEMDPGFKNMKMSNAPGYAEVRLMPGTGDSYLHRKKMPNVGGWALQELTDTKQYVTVFFT